MSAYWTDLVRRLTPYIPGEQRAGDNIVKLNTNENPYPPSDKVLSAIRAVGGESLRRYPDPEATELRQALANYHGLSLEQVFVGNGSDEILALAFMAFFTGNQPLQFPTVSYSFYPVYCDLFDIAAKRLPLADNFSLQLERFEANAGGIVFPNPNAPTGIAVSGGQIDELLSRHTDNVLLVDEAYADFGADSVVGLIKRFPNLLVSQTFSKGRSLAGMRIGAAFGDAALIDAMQRVKNSFNSYPVDVVAQRAGIASLADDASYRLNLSHIVKTRQWVVEALQQRGFRVLPSAANFVFVSPVSGHAGNLHAALNQQGVLVRYWPKPPLDNWLRISIGTDTEMEKLLAAIDQSQPPAQATVSS